ncbi:hypothetical protein B0H12DRAFT_1127134 [Mycena haematopus]|nr:hypothetical protein B0H12DRAFT_1127134 [Mycena haematopus]
MAVPTISSPFSLAEDVPDLDSVALPFTFADPEEEITRRAVRNLERINFVAVESWKCLRISRRRAKSAPRQDLSMLPSMQLEIILEIIGYLHPLELVQLSRTNKSFNDFLNSPITDLTWRNSFLVEDHPDSPADQLPLCPSQISGRRWAKLLFGPKICWECSQPNAFPDFRIWRRICVPCLEQNLLDVLPGYPRTHELNSIVKRSLQSAEDSDGLFDPERGRFWRSDGAAIAAQYEAVVASGGSEAAIRFVAEQRNLVSKYCELASRCDDWAWDTRDKFLSVNSKKLDRVANSVVKRLIAEGFDKRDVENSFYNFSDCDELDRKPRLTSKLWNRARPHILPSVINAQTERLAREREVRVRLRKDAIVATALIALRTPVPNLRHTYYAPPHTIESFPPIAELIAQNSDEPISPNEPQLSAALADAPAFVEAWAKETQTLLVSLLPGTEANKADFLDRATSVFRVRITNEGYEQTVIGWEEARAHLHWFQGRPEPHSVDDHLVKFNARGSAAAAELAVLLGMDPATATAADMDNADERFVCGNCQPEYRGGRLAMRWRDCILHVGTNVPASHDVPSWHRLSPLAVADVRRREEPDDYAPVRAWSCTLCNDFAPLFETQKNIEHHIRIKHGIDEPVEGEHLILFKGSESPRRKRVKLFIAGAHPARYRCNRCAQDHPDLVKLFSRRAIRLHVQDK